IITAHIIACAGTFYRGPARMRHERPLVDAECLRYQPMNPQAAESPVTIGFAPPPNRSAIIWGFSMATPPLTPRELVDRLDARHEELIARLDELNAQIEAALAEFARSHETAGEDPASRTAA
ncbi:MAG TPA: hypothetical protein VFW73_00380, partial [Lacipirellulaceae bacterium]|nr:hypothetical protein [Lacipirellulaceae bacterium]